MQKIKSIFTCALLVLALAALTACSGSNADKLNGKWAVDIDAMLAAYDKDHNASGLGAQMAKEAIGKMLGGMTFEFDTKNGKFTSQHGNITQSADFKVVGEKDKTVTLEARGDKLNVTFLNDDQITFADAKKSDQVLTLKRVK